VVAILVLCLLISLIVLLIANLIDRPTDQETELRTLRLQSQIERERAVAQARLIGAVAWRWTLNLLQVGVPLAATLLLGWIVVRRFSIVHADDAGGYPLFWLPRLELHLPRRYTDQDGRTRWLPLLSFRARLIDPNRNPTMGIELGERVSFIQAGTVSDAQMRATTQAQSVQLERARSAGTMLVQGNKRGQATPLSGTHLYRPIPEPKTLGVSSSHIQRLLVAQGEAEPSIIDVTPTTADVHNEHTEVQQ
jgi:hypothetical protein